MTLREEAQQNLWRAHCNFDDPRKAINIVIAKIYNDHEETTSELMAEVIHQSDKVSRLKAQLKAKESDLERQDMIIKCLNIDLDNKEKLLKAKNEEIERLKEIINTSIEEIEYAIIRPQYVEVYLNNAIRFLKEQQ